MRLPAHRAAQETQQLASTHERSSLGIYCVDRVLGRFEEGLRQLVRGQSLSVVVSGWKAWRMERHAGGQASLQDCR